MTKLTRENIITYQISQDINAWLEHQGKEKVFQYPMLIDRVCDISDVIKKSFEKVNEVLEKEGISPTDLSEVIADKGLPIKK